MLVDPALFIGKPGVEHRATSEREIVICPPDEIRPQGWHYGRLAGERWQWFPNAAQAELFWSGSDEYEVYT